MSCYEAGRDGFHLHRELGSWGIENLVVDAGSIERQVRRRRVKTDRIDGEKLLRLLMRHDQDDEKVWSVVRIPSVVAEDRRQINRELKTLQEEANQHRNRVRSLLVLHGLRLKLDRHFESWLGSVGQSLPPMLRRRVEREWERLKLVENQYREVSRERRQLIKEGQDPAYEQSRRLMQLKGIGIEGGWVLVMELFSWRGFSNRKQVGGLLGLTPTPRQSGSMDQEQGIDKAGIARVRTLMVELAWCWLRHQPQSALSLWYQKRFGSGSSRQRRVGIVALARKLLIALWRYLDQGIVPEGARFKVAAV
jgi:transposase